MDFYGLLWTFMDFLWTFMDFYGLLSEFWKISMECEYAVIANTKSPKKRLKKICRISYIVACHCRETQNSNENPKIYTFDIDFTME